MDLITLPTSDQPRASVVVLSQHSPWLLAECLDAVAAHSGRDVPYEVLLVLNNATPDLVLFVQRKVQGARVVDSDVNLGFGGGNNYAASLARGEFLVFLNDDATVEPGWLDALVCTADDHPEAAAVGSRILFPDGSLQEAGSVIWDDGSTAPIGRGAPAEERAFSYRRYVDHISANGLLVRKAVFDQVGGFDARYFPAYYEDVDLLLAIKAAGHRVLYEPLSQLRHHESASSTARFKEFLFKRNGAQLREKWAELLAGQTPADPENPAAVNAALHHGMGDPPRLLVIDDMLPDPGVGAGFGRMHDLIREVGFGRYAMTFHATNDPSGDPRGPGRFGVDVLTGEKDAIRAHLRDPAVRYDLILVSRPHNWKFFAEAIRAGQPDAVLLYDAEALFHLRMERQLALGDGQRGGNKLRKEMEEYRALEHRIARDADHIVCVSSTEAAILEEIPDHAPITVIEPMQPDVAVTERDARERDGIVYVAGWLARGDDAPNVDGLRWFATEVLPHLVNAMPWVRLDVTGANPPESVRRLESPNLRFVGFVPDLHQLYDAARVVISPIRYGAGIKIKTLEAIQYGVPVVTTTHGADGIRTGGRAAIAVADEPGEFVDAVFRLLTDPLAWRAQRAEILAVLKEWQGQPAKSWRDVLELARREGRREHLAV